jgi:RND family efflux transporter MFP subunit
LDQAKTASDAASAQADQARAAIHQAQQAISDSTIIAPFDGVISARFHSVGDTVSAMPPTSIFSITDPKNLEVRILVPEALIGFVSQNQEVSGTISPKGTPIKAKVRVIGSVIDTTTRTVEVLADVTEPLDGSLRSGLLVSIDLKEAEGLAGPFLPSSSIHNDPSGRFVYVVNGENLERRDVNVASVTPGTMWVRQGVSTNDLVVAGAVDSLRPGDKVAVMAD